ncbi:MAG: peptidylprolyl isomerase, partial [Gammaproteobacteria bacterium]|nr:peptidylprolyl isomerase [Gammaproteobacteria bacterium]
AGLAITPIESRDAYAEQVGFSSGFPVASDGTRAWLTHCYGMVGVGRGMEPNTGNGSSLYVVTGHAPRHLDRNITLVGRVLHGIENLTVLPRGTGPLGFYENVEQQVPVKGIRLGSDADVKDPITLEVMRTDSAAFGAYVTGRTHRNEDWFVDPTGRIELCNLRPPVRQVD